jgi:hypothetical protein
MRLSGRFIHTGVMLFLDDFTTFCQPNKLINSSIRTKMQACKATQLESVQFTIDYLYDHTDPLKRCS